jgi:DNA-binding MarR family transcriptional regulator
MYAALSERLEEFGISPPEWTLLGQIQSGAVTPVSLASKMGIDRAAVTRIIDALERKELLTRRPHPTDGRSSLLVLTRKGERLMPKLFKASQETNRLFLQLQSPEDSEMLVTLLSRVCKALPSRVYPLKDFDQAGR